MYPLWTGAITEGEGMKSFIIELALVAVAYIVRDHFLLSAPLIYLAGAIGSVTVVKNLQKKHGDPTWMPW